MAETSPIELDPNGDVVFKLGEAPESELMIVVSTFTLSLASPVFRAMFAGHFEEAHKLKQSRTTGRRPLIELSDDDPQAMLLLCKLSIS